jgi:hypothetical protein
MKRRVASLFAVSVRTLARFDPSRGICSPRENETGNAFEFIGVEPCSWH